MCKTRTRKKLLLPYTFLSTFVLTVQISGVFFENELLNFAICDRLMSQFFYMKVDTK